MRLSGKKLLEMNHEGKFSLRNSLFIFSQLCEYVKYKMFEKDINRLLRDDKGVR